MTLASILVLLASFAPQKEHQKAKHYLDLFLQSRNTLKSGHFVATGVFDPFERKKGKIECWFEGNRWMIERSLPQGVMQVLATEELCYVRVVPDGAVMLVSEKDAKWYAWWFDVRTIGFGNRDSLVGKPMGLKKLASLYFDGNLPFKVRDVTGDKVTLLRSAPKDLDIETRIVLDAKRGYVPLLIESRGTAVNQSQRTKWTEASGVTVPTSYIERDGISEVMNIKFEWQSVNKSYAAKFDQRQVFPGDLTFLRTEDEKQVSVDRPTEKWWSKSVEPQSLRNDKSKIE